MNYPIETTHDPGKTIYAILHHPDGRVWNTLSEEWEAFNTGNWALYAIPMAEQGASGYYRASLPSAMVGVLATEVLYSQGGGTPGIGDAPAIGIGQSQGVAVVAVGDSMTAAGNLQANLDAMIQGKAVAGALTTTQMTTDLPDATDGIYTGRLLIWTSGALLRKAAYIVGYDGATKKLHFGSVHVAPSVGDGFIIV